MAWQTLTHGSGVLVAKRPEYPWRVAFAAHQQGCGTAVSLQRPVTSRNKGVVCGSCGCAASVWYSNSMYTSSSMCISSPQPFNLLKKPYLPPLAARLVVVSVLPYLMSIPLVGKVVGSPARSRAFCFSSTGFDKDPSSFNLALSSAVPFHISASCRHWG